MNVALWGFGDFGKRVSESLFRYWGGRYTVAGIYDPSGEAARAPFWDVGISDPGLIGADHEKGVFESVIVCIISEEERTEVIEGLRAAGIPVLFPGDPADFLPSEEFAPETVETQESCRIYRCREVMAARADHLSWECVYVFDRSGRILKDPWSVNDWCDPELPLIYPFPFREPLPEKIRMPGSWCLLTKMYGNNFWHFTFQNLCDVLFLERAGFTGTYIIPNASYDRELMLMMGIAPERIISIEALSHHKVYVFDEVFGVQFDHRDTLAEAAAISKVAGLIKSRLKPDPSYPKYIYVKRTGTRKLLNGDEIAERFGFTTIIPEELSVREQMAYFRNADIVLCPHGANSANCLYMHENSVFIEVFSDRWYLDINAGACRENHVHHLKAVGKAAGKAKQGIKDDCTIPKSRILLVMKRACSLLPEPPVRPEDPDVDLEGFDPAEVCGDCSGMLIYGAGALGEQACAMVTETYGDKLLGFAVTAMEGNPPEKAGYPVRSIEEWTKLMAASNVLPGSAVVFLALNPVYNGGITEGLREKGYKHIFLLEDLEWLYHQKSKDEAGRRRITP